MTSLKLPTSNVVVISKNLVRKYERKHTFSAQHYLVFQEPRAVETRAHLNRPTYRYANEVARGGIHFIPVTHMLDRVTIGDRVIGVASARKYTFFLQLLK